MGAYLLRRLLQKGYRVRALRRKSSDMELVQGFADRVEWVEADVTDIVALEDAFQGVTELYHCAAMVSFHPKDTERMMRINVEGTANVVNMALETGVRKMVHVSSIAALGRTKERPRLDEKAKWVQSKGNSNYAVSKYGSEQEVWRAHAEGLPVAIVNPSIILGSGHWNLGSAKFFKQIDEGLKFCPTGCSGFVDVRDVARFMVELMESDISGERYILNAQDIDFRDFFVRIAQSLGKTPPPITVTPLLAELAWRVEWLKEKLTGMEPIVTKESARSSVSKYYYDNAKSRSVFGFEYRRLADSIQETGVQYLEAKKEGLKAMMLGD